MNKLLTADNLIEHGVTAQSLSHILQISYVHAWRIMTDKSPINFVQSEYLKIVLGVHPVYVRKG